MMYAQSPGRIDNDEPDPKENLPLEYQGYPNSLVDDLYNKLESEKDDNESERIVDHYLKYGIVFLKTRYVDEILV